MPLKHFSARQMFLTAIVMQFIGIIVAGMATIPTFVDYIGFISAINVAFTSASATLARFSGVKVGDEAVAAINSQTTILTAQKVEEALKKPKKP